MQEVKSLYAAACDLYNKLQPHYGACKTLFVAAHAKLLENADYSHFGNYAGTPTVPYYVFLLKAPRVASRPVRPDLYLSDPKDFLSRHDEFIASLQTAPQSWNEQQRTCANRVIYTAVLSVACCYDLWQRGSRKTPGTFFEILIAGILQVMLPHAAFTKHIPLASLLHDKDVEEAAAEPESVDGSDVSTDVAASTQPDSEKDSGVSTDLVIGIRDQPGGIVVPLKITTRERIVQPFAHQRILDSAFGEGVYKSLLMCISETQLDEKTQSVKQVCVPGTIKLFQKYLARLSGIYYCDVPQRYAAEDMKRTVIVKSVGDFFADVSEFLAAHGAR